MFNWVKRKKWLVANALLVGVLVSLLGIQVVDTSDAIDRSVKIGIGNEKVITLGHIAYAAGLVDYTYDGVDDDVQFQAALNALPITGGRLVDVSAVQKNFSANVTRAIPNVTITGSGAGSYFVHDGITALFVAGGNGWHFSDLRTDAGGIGMGATTNGLWTNVTIDTQLYTYYAPTAGIGSIFDFSADTVSVNTLDIADPEVSLIYTSGIITTPLYARNIWVENGYMYFCEETNGVVSVWDVYIPSAPVKLGEVSVAPMLPLDIRKQGNYLFVTSNSYVGVIDVSNPSAPTVVRLLTSVLLNNAHGNYLLGDYLYVACYSPTNRLTIVDISNPAYPRVVGSLSHANLNGAHDVVVDYPYAYVATHHGPLGVNKGSITIVNVSDPRSPTYVVSNTVEETQYAHIVKKGGYVFAGGPGKGICAFDVTDPTVTPVLVDTLGVGGGYWFALAGDYLFTGSNSDTDPVLRMINISDPSNMSLASPWSGKGIRNLFIDGRYIYATTIEVGGGSRFIVLEITNALSLPSLSIGNKTYPDTVISPLDVDSPPKQWFTYFLRNINYLDVPTNSSWTASHNGTGAGTLSTTYIYTTTGATPYSVASYSTPVYGFGLDEGNGARIGWNNVLHIIFNYMPAGVADSGIIRRFQLKETAAIGVLAAKGVGIRANDLALIGESYGTVLGEVDLGISLVAWTSYQIEIIHYPGLKIEWWVNGVLKGTQATTTKIPSSNGGAIPYFVTSIQNDDSGTNAVSHVMQPKIWQIR